MASSLVSCEWLKEQMDKGTPGIKVLDGTWHNPIWKRNAAEEYVGGHIPGAVRFDFSVVANRESKQPIMLPPADQFAQQVGEMGVSNDTHVVLYDNNEKLGMYSVGRAWWMFKIFGHEKVSVLDGGIPRWISCGYPVEKGPEPQVSPVSYKATFNPTLLRDLKQVKEAIDTKSEQVIDGRPKGRYDGTAPEPNPKLRSGHILGSVSLPFTMLIDPQTKTFKSKEGIKQAFDSVGVDLEKPMLMTCGGAVVAGMLAFSLHQIGKQVPVYDGSWSDWVVNAPDDTKHLGIKGEDL